MKNNQLTKGEERRVMYIENKEGDIDGLSARIGWASFSKTSHTVYYRGRVLKRAKGGGINGDYFDAETGEKYWVSGIKKRGSNAHYAEPVDISIDEDALYEYRKIKNG